MSSPSSDASFYYRVFAGNDKKIWLDEIERFLAENQIELTALGVCDEEDEDDLDAESVEILFVDASDREVAVLEYDRKGDSEMVDDEIGEFLEIIEEMNPARNRGWVREKLEKTTACFAFSILEAGFEEKNWDGIATLAAWIRDETAGFEQSDGGQIANEDGSVVLLADDDASDWFECPVAVRDGDAWAEKEIDSQDAFSAFLKGEI